MTSNSPRRIFNNWDDTGLPAGTNAIGKLTAGEAHIGEVGKKYVSSTATIYLDTTAYAALDNAGSGVGTLGAIVFPNAARVAGGGGIIRGAVFTDSAVQDPDFTMIVFSAAPGTTVLDNSPFDIAAADLNKVAGIIIAGTGTVGAHYPNTSKAWKTIVLTSIQSIETVIPFVCATGTSLYAKIRADAAWDATVASDLGVKLLIEQG